MTSYSPRLVPLTIILSGALTGTTAGAQGASTSFRLEEVYRVGTSDSSGVEDPQRLFLVAGALLDCEQNLLVLDAGHGRVQMFRRGGAYWHTLGFGIGPGPGRFMSASSISWLVGDSILGVLDRQNSAVTVFRKDEGMVGRIRLPAPLGPAWSLTVMPGESEYALSAFARDDSTTLQIVSRNFVRLKGTHRWPVERDVILLNRLGGGFLAAARSGIVLGERNPARLLFFDTRGSLEDVIPLDEHAPAADSTVVRRGSGGIPMVSSARVAELTGLAVVSDSIVLLSTSFDDRVGSRFLLVHRKQGVLRTWESRDTMRIIGGEGGYVVVWLNIGGEFVGVYQLKEEP